MFRWSPPDRPHHLLTPSLDPNPFPFLLPTPSPPQPRPLFNPFPSLPLPNPLPLPPLQPPFCHPSAPLHRPAFDHPLKELHKMQAITKFSNAIPSITNFEVTLIILILKNYVTTFSLNFSREIPNVCVKILLEVITNFGCKNISHGLHKELHKNFKWQCHKSPS